MPAGPSIAEVAALIGNPARANILIALLDGSARTATELAGAAGVSAQTTSGHLRGLTEGRLLIRQTQGRHVYHRLASPLVGAMLETIMAVAGEGRPDKRPPRAGEAALRAARTCYDHLAGRLGVALAVALEESGRIELGGDGGRVTAKGTEFFRQWGLDLNALEGRKRAFCRPCLDWSERRYHLAGALGAALTARCFELGWVERMSGTRAVSVTASGEQGFREGFGLAAAPP